MDDTDLYERDFYAWTNQQATLLRAGLVAEADTVHLAEEIDAMGKAEKRELVSRLTVLLLHLLKWQFQPSHRGASWRASIGNARDDLADHLDDNPSLKLQLSTAIAASYRRARRQAAAEAGLQDGDFPPDCPWPPEDVLDENFWP